MAKILLVEDSPTQAAVLSHIFEEAGFTVIHRKDAESGLDVARSDSVDLVVSDLQLPAMSGFELCKTLKIGKTTYDIPVVILTSDSAPANVLLGLESGADGFITKNHCPEEILARVQRTLAIRAAGSAVQFQGRTFQLNVGATQLSNVLVSAFEDGVELNRMIRQSEAALRLANRELSKVNEALAAANEVKDKFLRIAAHDLRSPLAVIQGFVALMTDGTLGAVNEDQIDALQRIGRSVETMLALLTDLLDVSALRAGKMAFHAEQRDVTPLFRDAIDAVTQAAKQKRIEIVTNVAPSLPEIQADPLRILEVVSNLMTNAVKFTPRGGRVEIGSRALTDGVEFWVKDSGPGIQANEAHLLFQPFSKLSARPTGGEQSTGLGLSIVKEIVEWHGGTVVAESPPGAGATFRVTLPLRLAKPSA